MSAPGAELAETPFSPPRRPSTILDGRVALEPGGHRPLWSRRERRTRGPMSLCSGWRTCCIFSGWQGYRRWLRASLHWPLHCSACCCWLTCCSKLLLKRRQRSIQAIVRAQKRCVGDMTIKCRSNFKTPSDWASR
jgi:hypothetical protein